MNVHRNGFARVSLKSWVNDSIRSCICSNETKLLPAAPGQVERYDYQYVRNGTVTNFMFSQPLGDWRRVSVRERKTCLDFAEEIAHLLDVDFSRCGGCGFGDGQFEYPYDRFALQTISAGASEGVCEAIGDSLHAEARQLAERRRD